MKPLLVALAVMAISFGAAARGPDGALNVIREPNDGMPVAIKPAESFEVVLNREANLFLVRDDKTEPLSVQWIPSDSGHVLGHCATSAGVSPGLYGLEARWDGGTDRVNRAVYIAANYPANYLFVLLGEIGLDGQDTSESAGRFQKRVEAINGSPAAFVVMTGNQTAHGSPAEYQQLLSILDTCKRPTYLCAGPADGATFNSYFSRSDYAFTWGEDGFLACDTRDALPAWDLGDQAGRLQRRRLAIKAKRWSIGFSYQYSERMGIRSQLALFVDDPLDYFLVSAIMGEAEAKTGHVLWGATPLKEAPGVEEVRLRFGQVKDEEVSFPEAAAPSTSK